MSKPEPTTPTSTSGGGFGQPAVTKDVSIVEDKSIRGPKDPKREKPCESDAEEP